MMKYLNKYMYQLYHQDAITKQPVFNQLESWPKLWFTPWLVSEPPDPHGMMQSI
jgi:hypothetical protein